MKNFGNVNSEVKLKIITLTCSLDVTAQKTISVKPCVGNIRKQIPPITLLSLMRARHLCFLSKVYQMIFFSFTINVRMLFMSSIKILSVLTDQILDV